MSDNKSSDSRRKLLKSIAAGSGAVIAGKNLPESWKRPVVDSVMLPAHAQTSPTEPTPPACTTEHAGTYQGIATGTIDRCDGTVDDPVSAPLQITIGEDCSVSVIYTGNNPLEGTGTIVNNSFTVDITREQNCSLQAGGNRGDGTVTGTVSGTQVSGTASFSGPCVCYSTDEPTYSTTATYTIDKI